MKVMLNDQNLKQCWSLWCCQGGLCRLERKLKSRRWAVNFQKRSSTDHVRNIRLELMGTDQNGVVFNKPLSAPTLKQQRQMF